MAFFYYFTSGFNAAESINQTQVYYSQSPLQYQNSLEITNGPYSPWAIPENQNLVKYEPVYTISTSVPVEEVQSSSSGRERGPVEKRRIEKNLEKEIVSARKNSESNLINQFYSFFGSREKSQRVVEKCCCLLGKTEEEVEKILPLFYLAIKTINTKRGRTYVNAASLVKFFTPGEFEGFLPRFGERVQECCCLDLGELC